MSFKILLIAFFLVFTAMFAAFPAEPTPAETAYMRGDGNFSVGFYGQFYSTKNNPYISLKGKALKFPVIEAGLGFGEKMDFELYWPAYIYWDGDKEKETTFGDARIFSKVRLKKKENYSLAFRVGFKIPSTSDDSRLGTDKTDIFGTLLFSRRIGEADLHVNFGIGILGNPYKERAQMDVLTYAAAFDLPLTEKLVWHSEVYGYSDEEPWTDMGTFKTGIRQSFGRFTLRTSVMAGYTSRSPEWGVEFGISKTFKLPL